MDNENKQKQDDKSIVAAATATFTLKWFVQTIAAWAVSQWLTKKWNKWKKKKEKEDASDN